MDLLATALPALGLIVNPVNLAFIVLGVVVGAILGVLPGFGAAQALALMLPFTFGMDAATASLFFVAIYSSAEYGGSIPAILIRTPGTSAATMTLLDGYPMALQGKAIRALKISLIGGTVAGMVSSVAFLLAASFLAWLGLQFGPGEMFAVGVFGLSIIASFFGKSLLRGLFACGLGLLLAMVGSSGFGGLRFTFDHPALLDGLPLVVVIIGLLAMPEVFALMAERRQDVGAVQKVEMKRTPGNDLPLADCWKLMPSFLRGTVVGTIVGAIPGPGAAVSSIVAYNEEKRWSKTPEKFGTGIDEGVAAPEAANNAVVAGSLVPTLALGVPGSGAIAVLLGLLISKGIVPGPLLFSTGDPLIMAIFFGLIACNIVILALGLVSIPTLAAIAAIPRHILAPFVLIVLLIGTYAYQNYAAHVVIALLFGALAIWLEKLGISVIPIVLAFVMGPIVEKNLLRGLAINGGDFLQLVSRPITAGFLLLALLTVVLSLRRRKREFAEA